MGRGCSSRQIKFPSTFLQLNQELNWDKWNKEVMNIANVMPWVGWTLKGFFPVLSDKEYSKAEMGFYLSSTRLILQQNLWLCLKYKENVSPWCPCSWQGFGTG